MKERFSMSESLVVNEVPIKNVDAVEPRDPALLHEQAERASQARVEVDYHGVPGTCLDEREREEGAARPSVKGGPDIEALYVAELTGYFDDDSDAGPKERLTMVKRVINAAGIKSGGHKRCAAAASFGGVMEIIADNPEAVTGYAEDELGPHFDKSAAEEVIARAQKIVYSGRYKGVSMEEVLAEVLAESGESDSIEELKGEHEGKTLVRQKKANKTVDQTELHNLGGEDSFVYDDPYADEIEHAMTAGPDAVRRKVVAEHAREISLAAIANAVPNKELYQIDLN